VQVNLEQPQTLGTFERTKAVYSMMLLMTYIDKTGKVPVLCGASL
jgi:hypothetical protein